MVVTRSMSGATKKADTKVSVNHNAAERERSPTEIEDVEPKVSVSHKAAIERERAWRERTLEKVIHSIKMNEEQLLQKAADLYLSKTFFPQYRKENGFNYDFYEVQDSGYDTFEAPGEKDKDLYRAMAKKWKEEQIASAKRRIMHPGEW